MLGAVEVLRDGRWQPIAVGETLSAGVMLKTAEGSRVALQLANGAQIKINANCQLELKEIISKNGLKAASNTPVQNILRILQGEIWVRSNSVPLEIQSMPVIATIRGTEFNFAVGADQVARLAVVEGLVDFHNPQGRVTVAANEQATAKVGEAPRKTVLLDPLDAVQWSLYYPGLISYRDYAMLDSESPETEDRPQSRSAALTLQGWKRLEAGEAEAALAEFRQFRSPTLMSSVGIAEALYRLNRFDEADRVIAGTQQRYPRAALPWVQAARSALVRGRVPEAQRALDQALARDPRSALAHSLRSNIDLVQNRKAQARDAAERAIAANPASPTAYLSLSLVEQADFDLDASLATARKAVALDPDNPRALIQESRLLFGMGRLKEASKIAEKARQRAPQDALVNSTWGFLQLARGRSREAGQAFQKAIAQDSTLGEPHLGLGLALFRRNQTEAAVEEMRKATLLEPKVSLYNSYLGKAYFEIKDDRLAQKYFAQAKQLDPRDPTPHFYDAIRLQSVNRPVEAVRDVQTSTDLNDNRAVYRSRLLLDEDLAARTAALGKIYSQLGFGQLGLKEGSQSLASDPTNHSAHRLLADSYLLSSKHESARLSELLQSQLLQPLNVSPVQPRLAEANLYSLGGFGPSTASLHEYNPLFARNRPVLSVTGIVGNNKTLSDEMSVSGITDRFSYSLGQAHHQTDGFRDNAELRYDLYNVFAQAAVTSQLDLQIEYRWRETKQGNFSLDPESSSDNDSRKERQDTVRLGAHYLISSNSDVLLSLIYTDIESDTFNSHTDLLSQQAEAQYLFRGDRFNLIIGGGITDSDKNIYSESAPPPGSDHMVTGYLYGNLNWPRDIIWTMGLGHSVYEQDKFNLANDFLPKLGVRWNISNDFSLRAAYLQTVKRNLVSNPTIEPTQVAGFNQFFDDINGAKASLYGIGLDGKLSGQIRVGAEVVRRDLDSPAGLKKIVYNDWREDIYRAYLYWMIGQHWAVSAEFDLEEFEQINEIQDSINPKGFRIETITAPLTVQYFDPSGFFATLGATYIKQDVKYDDFNGEEFVVVDAAIGYRLPNRWGLLSLEVRNLFDKSFYLKDETFRTASDFTGLQTNARFIPDRAILAGIRLNF